MPWKHFCDTFWGKTINSFIIYPNIKSKQNVNLIFFKKLWILPFETMWYYVSGRRGREAMSDLSLACFTNGFGYTFGE